MGTDDIGNAPIVAVHCRQTIGADVYLQVSPLQSVSYAACSRRWKRFVGRSSQNG